MQQVPVELWVGWALKMCGVFDVLYCRAMWWVQPKCVLVEGPAALNAVCGIVLV